jgi:hypothetical protein
MNVHRADQHLMNRCALYKKCRTCPIPNSSQLVFPTISAPASCKSFTTVAEKGEVKSVFRISRLGFVACEGWRTLEHPRRARCQRGGGANIVFDSNGDIMQWEILSGRMNRLRSINQCVYTGILFTDCFPPAIRFS